MKNEELKQKISNLVDEYIKENGVFDKMKIEICPNYLRGAKVKEISKAINIEIEL